jgi:hypothetical protein
MKLIDSIHWPSVGTAVGISIVLFVLFSLMFRSSDYGD